MVERRLLLRLLHRGRLRSSWRVARGVSASVRASVRLQMLTMVLVVRSPLMTRWMADGLTRPGHIPRHRIMLLPWMEGRRVRVSVLRRCPRRPRLCFLYVVLLLMALRHLLPR